MTLIGHHELVAAVAVPVVEPVNERRHPLAGSLHAREWPAQVVSTVFGRPEQRFRVRVVIRHPWSGEGSEYSQLLQTAFECCDPQLFEKPAASALPLSACRTRGSVRRQLDRRPPT